MVPVVINALFIYLAQRSVHPWTKTKLFALMGLKMATER